MSVSQIRWKQGDYVKLGRAVSEFNKKIKQIETEENKLYLPDLENYKEIKGKIKTRQELNRYINSLKRFSKKGAEDKYITEIGEEMTVWERKELGIQSRIAQTRLTRELKNLSEPKKEFGGFSRREMGSQRVREIEAQLKNLKQIENKKGFEFKKLKSRIKNIGTSDYQMRKAITFRENFLNELRNLANGNPEFQKVYDYFSSIKNPHTFFETTQKSNALQDFFLWYTNPENYAGFSDLSELTDFIINEYE